MVDDNTIKQKVNKVTATINQDTGDTTITLYNNNQRIGSVSNFDIEVPIYEDCGIPNKSKYLSYCKDVIINLLQNGGVEGFYYEYKHVDDANNGKPSKFDKSLFITRSRAMINELLDDMLYERQEYTYRVSDNNKYDGSNAEITQKYKDGYVKYGNADYTVTVTHGGEDKVFTVSSYIKSGQLCKPKIMVYDENEVGFNVTNITKMFK